jgi:hypothetical protein
MNQAPTGMAQRRRRRRQGRRPARGFLSEPAVRWRRGDRKERADERDRVGAGEGFRVFFFPFFFLIFAEVGFRGVSVCELVWSCGTGTLHSAHSGSEALLVA